MQTPGAQTRDVLKAICECHGVELDDVIGRRRFKRLTPARRAVAQYLRLQRGMTLTQAGMILGGRDHTTVHYLACGRPHQRAGGASPLTG